MGWMADETGLGHCEANFAPLTPLTNLQRAALIWPDREALVYGDFRKTFGEYHARVSRLASALVGAGITPGDVVATLLPNVPAHAEAHFGVPACGAVLNAINTRLEAQTISYILDHGGARVVLVDPQLIPVLATAIDDMEGEPPMVIEVPDPRAGVHAFGDYISYEDFLAGGDPDFDWIMPQDEWESIALNYTSGTTGRPKGVVYSHRGAHLNALGSATGWGIPLYTRYLGVVPFFHCNGWCAPWLLPQLGSTLVCNRDVTAANIFAALADEKVTHFGGAPIVLSMLVNAAEADRRPLTHEVHVMTAGAPPAASVLGALAPMGFNVIQAYGLTETYGAISLCSWDEERDGHRPSDEQAVLKARQGVPMPSVDAMTVLDEADAPVPRDGRTQGEIAIRGNSVMKGYLKNPRATEQAFRGGWFHSGDIAVQHPDNYVQISDRAKDIIISGGENISSVEVEGVMMAHPAVMLCAVVAQPDEKWGEVPCAFVELKEGQSATEAELIAFAREHLAGFKTPKAVRFRELPKTPTGKIQKFELRRALRETA